MYRHSYTDMLKFNCFLILQLKTHGIVKDRRNIGPYFKVRQNICEHFLAKMSDLLIRRPAGNTSNSGFRMFWALQSLLCLPEHIFFIQRLKNVIFFCV